MQVMEYLLPLLETSTHAFCIKLALNLSLYQYRPDQIPDKVLMRLCSEIKDNPADSLLYLPFVYIDEPPAILVYSVFPALPQSLATAFFISTTSVSPLQVSAARLALKRPFSLENFAICSRYCNEDLLYRSHLKNAFKCCENQLFYCLFNEIYFNYNPDLKDVFSIEISELRGLTDFRRFYQVFYTLMLTNQFADVFAALDQSQYMLAIYTNPRVSAKVREHLQLQYPEAEKTDIGLRLKSRKFVAKAHEFLLDNIDLLLLRFTAINLQFNELPQFWNLVPPNRRESNELVELVEELIEMSKGHPICRFTMQNALGRILIAFSQMESEQSFERALTLFYVYELEGLPAKWYSYLQLVMALLNNKTRFLASQKLRFALQSEIYAQFEEFPGIFGYGDLLETFEFGAFCFDSYSPPYQELLAEINTAEILQYDDNESFVKSAYYQAFFYLFTDLPNLDVAEVKLYRESMLTLLCQKAVLSMFTVNFVDAAPAILIHIMLKFLEVSFSEDLDLRSCFLYYATQFSSIIGLFFYEDAAIRGAAGRILLQEVKCFAAMPATIHSNLSPQYASFVLELGQKDAKILPFYYVEETLQAVAVGLVLERQMHMDEFSSKLFYYPKYYHIGCYIDRPSSEKDIIWYEIIQKCYLDYISRSYNLTSVLEFLQTQFVAPASSNALFLKALRLFDMAFERSSHIEFRVKTGVLTFANGILSLEKGRQFTNQAVRLYLKILCRYVQGQKSTNLCYIVSYLCSRLIASSLDYFEPLILEVLQILSYCDVLPDNFEIRNVIAYCKTGTLTNEQFRQLLALMRLYAVHCQLKGSVIIDFQEITSFVVTYSTLIFYNCTHICDMIKEIQRKMQLLIQPNVEQFVDMRRSLLHLQKLVFQELYFYKSDENLLLRKYSYYFLELFLQLLKDDFLHIAEGRMIELRKNQRADYVSKYATALFNVNATNLFRYFLLLAKKSMLAQFFAAEDGVLYFRRLIYQDTTAGDCLWTCYDEYLQFLPEATPKMEMLSELLKVDVETLSVAHLDLLQRLTSNDGDFYQRRQFTFVPFNYCFYLLQNSFQRSEIEVSLILAIISNIMDKTDISKEFLQLCKYIYQKLHFYGSASEKISLAFLCHVRNCMDANDIQRSDILPGALIKCIKELLPNNY